MNVIYFHNGVIEVSEIVKTPQQMMVNVGMQTMNLFDSVTFHISRLLLVE